jgi:hypothetical protein
MYAWNDWDNDKFTNVNIKLKSILYTSPRNPNDAFEFYDDFLDKEIFTERNNESQQIGRDAKWLYEHHMNDKLVTLSRKKIMDEHDIELNRPTTYYYTIEYKHHPFGHIVVLYDNGYIEMLELGLDYSDANPIEYELECVRPDETVIDYTIGKFIL